MSLMFVVPSSLYRASLHFAGRGRVHHMPRTFRGVDGRWTLSATWHLAVGHGDRWSSGRRHPRRQRARRTASKPTGRSSAGPTDRRVRECAAGSNRALASRRLERRPATPSPHLEPRPATPQTRTDRVDGTYLPGQDLPARQANGALPVPCGHARRLLDQPAAPVDAYLAAGRAAGRLPGEGRPAAAWPVPPEPSPQASRARP